MPLLYLSFSKDTYLYALYVSWYHGIKNGIKYFSRYCLKVSNFSILTTLCSHINCVIRSIYLSVDIVL